MDSTKPLTLPGKKPRILKGRRFATTRNVVALMLREMSTRYGRTPGGYIWAVLEPVAAILFLSLGFSLLLRSPSLGTSFILFYTSGFLILQLYNNISNPVSRCINFSRPLLRYPAVNWMDSMIARLLLNTLTNITIMVILLTLIIASLDVSTSFDLPPMIQACLLTILVGFGVGALNCVLIGLFPVWDVIWSILTRPLFIASGVIFIYEDLPTVAQNILWYNPLMHLTGLFREGIYPTYTPVYIDLTYVLFFSMISLTLGLILTRRYNRVILNR